MTDLAGLPDRECLAELLLRWEELFEQGQDTPAAELAKDRPDLVPELARRIKALKAVSWVTQPLADDPSEPGASPSTPPREGRLGGRYRLEGLVATGGFGEVFRGFDEELQRPVAIKMPRPGRVGSRDAFLTEARRVARLRHDGIVPVYDVGVDGDGCFIVSEFLEGGSLADRLAGQRPSREQAIRWIAEVADALEYAHLHGVVHLDIKPPNILVDHHGRAKVADFGIAQSAAKSGEAGPSLGTLRYMSPEQLQGKPTDHRSDIYSLGVVLHEMLTGAVPYESLEPQTLRRDILAGSPKVSDRLESPLRDACRKALSRDPQARHASAAQFAAEIRKVVDGTTRPTPWPWIVVAALLLAGGAYAAVRSSGGKPSTNPSRPAHEILAIATTNMLHGHFEDAEKGFAEVLAQDPQNIEAVKGRGYCLLNMNRLDAAVADLDRVLVARPDDAATLRRRSRAHALLRDFPRAISDLRRTIELMPNATELPGELATVYAIRSHERFEAGDYEGSREDMDEVIRLDPKPAVNYSRRGACWFHIGEYEKSVADMTEAIRREPGNPEFHEKRSYAFRKLGRNEEAEADEKKARELRQ